MKLLGLPDAAAAGGDRGALVLGALRCLQHMVHENLNVAPLDGGVGEAIVNCAAAEVRAPRVVAGCCVE